MFKAVLSGLDCKCFLFKVCVTQGITFSDAINISWGGLKFLHKMLLSTRHRWLVKTGICAIG